MPLPYVHAVCIHYKVAVQHSTLHCTPPRLLQYIKKVSLGMHTIGDNLVPTLNFGFQPKQQPLSQ